ncbi:MAG: GAF domain-containing protein [Chloroflexi bacterium]|nr:GAF domain-containing protein [Chloroflexota bacterium]
MKDEAKTKARLIEELAELRQQNEGLEAALAKWTKSGEALRQSQLKMQAILDNMLQSFVLLDRQGQILAVNDTARRNSQVIFGLTAQEGGSIYDFVDERNRPGFDREFAAVLTGNPVRLEAPISTPNDGFFWFDISFSPIVNQDGKVWAVALTVLDVTKRKQTEETLQQRNRELALLNNASQAFNSSLDLDVVLVSLLEEVRPLLGVIGASVWLIDAETGELVCHQASGAHRVTLRGWHLPPSQGIVGWVAQNDQTQNVLEVQADPRHFKMIERLLDLELHSILAVPLRSKEKVIGVLEVVDTVANRFTETEVLLVESLAATAAIAIENARLYEQTRRDAETRAVLLQEVNHRTKNNLAAIIGLLHLEQRHMSNEARTVYQTMMQDLISRIHGLATAHRLLSTADWSPILLSELATKVIHSALQALPLDKNVLVEVSPASIKVAPKLTNTLALVINELTTNTVKYAWPACEIGHIVVHIKNDGDEVSFEFRDDGTGFPADVLSLERYGVGWELIQTLVRQGLQGTVTLYNDHGAVITIRYPQLL